MKAIKFDVDGTSSVVNIAKPVPGAGEVLVQVLSASVCGSDLAALSGTHPFRQPPLISGHEGGGVVVEVGAGVDPALLGAQVVIDPQKSCRRCELCTSGNYNLCRKKTMLGVPAWDGCFAEFVLLPQETLIVAPESIASQDLTLAEPVAVAHHAVEKLSPDKRDGDHLILGGGAVGALIALILKVKGARRVVVVEPKEDNHAMLSAMGVDEILTSTDVFEDGDGAEFTSVFIAAGVGKLVDISVENVVPKGTIVQVAVFKDPVPVDVGKIQIKEIEFIGTATYVREDFVAAIKLMEDHSEAIAAIVTHEKTLEGAVDLINDMVRGIGDNVIKLRIHPQELTGTDVHTEAVPS